MIERYTEIEVLAAVPRLTEVRLKSFVEMQIVVPMRDGDRAMFGAVDLARMELLCDLAEQFGLEEDGLGIIMSLIDQLHAARWDFGALAAAVAAEPAETRKRVAARFRQERSTGAD